jgi:small ubiquitin-related modifier
MEKAPGSEMKKDLLKAETITVRISSQSSDTVHVKVKKDAPMHKIFQAYAAQIGTQASQLKFIYDGERLKETDSPKMLEMEDNDEIQAVLEQVGGN